SVAWSLAVMGLLDVAVNWVHLPRWTCRLLPFGRAPTAVGSHETCSVSWRRQSRVVTPGLFVPCPASRAEPSYEKLSTGELSTEARRNPHWTNLGMSRGSGHLTRARSARGAVATSGSKLGAPRARPALARVWHRTSRMTATTAPAAPRSPPASGRWP